MLVGMDSKASHAKGIPGITLTIALCLCAAFRAQMGGVQFVPLVECTRVHVPTSLTFLLLYDDMFGQCAGPSAHGRCRSLRYHSACLSSSPSPVFCKIPMSASPFLLARARACIHLCDRQKESELPIGPPFCCPNIFQTWIVTTIVDVINPVLGRVVSTEGLGVFEGSPHAIHEPPRRIVLNLVQNPMRRHDLRDVVTIFGAMHQESLSFHLLNKRLCVAQRLRHHVP